MGGLLEVEGLKFKYTDNNLFNDVSFRILQKDHIVLVGDNGCGKSTLLRVISRIIAPTEGEVFLDGVSLLSLTRTDSAKRVAYLPQSRNTSDIRVSSLVLHGRFPYTGYPRKYREEDYVKVENALRKMGIEDKKDQLVSSLSGGERQKVYIAMCLVQETDVLLFDEPTTFLDISRQFKLLDEAKKLAREGKCVVIVLHDIIQALETADNMVVMDEGRVVMEDTPSSVYDSGILEKVFSLRINKESSHYYYSRKDDENTFHHP